MVDNKRLQESIDRSEIINLIGKSILTRDSGMWERLAECYHSGAEFTSSWFKGKPSDFLGAARDRVVGVMAWSRSSNRMSSHRNRVSTDRANLGNARRAAGDTRRF